MKNKIILKPCPMCGSTKLAIHQNVECLKCGLSTATFVYVLGEHTKPEQLAANAWNTRYKKEAE